MLEFVLGQTGYNYSLANMPAVEGGELYAKSEVIKFDKNLMLLLRGKLLE
jgi:hypothetical protein